MGKKIYVSPAIKAQTMTLLVDYKKNHPTSRTPMAEALSATPNTSEADYVRFMRAARALGWKVTRHHGGYYENGIKIWQ